MDTNNELSVKGQNSRPVIIVAVLITYLLAGFITTCICGVVYLILK